MIDPVSEPQHRIQYGGVIAGEEEVAAAARVLRSSQWSGGPETDMYEQELAQALGFEYAVSCNSGSSALLLALAALQLPKGARVAMPALQFPTLYSAAVHLGLTPALVDIDDSLNMARIPEGGRPAFDAVVFVEVCGNTTNLHSVWEGCRRANIPLIVDACEGMGSWPIGGTMTCISTHAAHMISTGEGGAILTDDGRVSERLRRLRDWGRAYGTASIEGYYDNYVFSELGFNLRLTEIQAAIGRVQLKRLPKFTEKRKAIWNHFWDNLSGLVDVPRVDTEEWVPFAFAALTPRRDSLVLWLDALGIETRPLLAGNMPRQPATPLPRHPEGFPNADRAFREGLWWGVHPSMTAADIDHVITAVRGFFK